jgi:hypothetical protein
MFDLRWTLYAVYTPSPFAVSAVYPYRDLIENWPTKGR